jgi:hypothetical protein
MLPVSRTVDSAEFFFDFFAAQLCLFSEEWHVTSRWQYFGTMLCVLFFCHIREWTRWQLHRVQTRGKFACDPREIAIEALYYVMHVVCCLLFEFSLPSFAVRLRNVCRVVPTS